jgi:mRNA-degrading endonuclease toxin of MazEF toxin-antitoxin module
MKNSAFRPAQCLAMLWVIILCAPWATAWGGEDHTELSVMVMLDEKIAGIFQTLAFEDLGQAESMLMQELTAAGFNVLDPRTVKANIARDQAMRILEGDDFAAASAGLRFAAQVVITGKAFAKQTGIRPGGTQMQSIQGTVQLRAIRSDDGRVLATQSAQAAAAHIDEVQGGVQAVRKAARQAGEALIVDILASTRQQDLRGDTLTVMISNLVSYRHLAAVKAFFENELPGIQAVHQRSYTMGTAELGLEFAGNSADLADELAHRRFPGFRLEPTNVTPSRVDLRAVLE